MTKLFEKFKILLKEGFTPSNISLILNSIKDKVVDTITTLSSPKVIARI